MQTAPSAQDLVELARRNDPASRARLLDTMVELCQMQSADPAARDLIGALFSDLARKAERDIRMALSNRLAHVDWAPRSLINLLALDEIEIAGPVIAESPVLTEADLLEILQVAPLDHRVAVAARPHLGAQVAGAILDGGEGEVLTALAGNHSAHLGDDGMSRLVEASRRVVALRGQLARHPRLTPDLGARLYEWVGEALQTAICGRFELDPALVGAAIGKAIESATAGAPSTSEDDDESLQRLVDKLQSAGQLRQGTLFRLLRERRPRMFCIALGKLADLDPAAVRRALDASNPELLALACAGAAIDRGVFVHLLEGVREINGGLPGGGAEGARRALGAFAPFPAAVAAGAFRQASAV
ncbi:MAG: hypothetical protein JWM33_1798 [Caulobacteraceae bacterium]|nr:hypothetical protein [Caulobacteraceae bacterium]